MSVVLDIAIATGVLLGGAGMLLYGYAAYSRTDVAIRLRRERELRKVRRHVRWEQKMKHAEWKRRVKDDRR